MFASFGAVSWMPTVGRANMDALTYTGPNAELVHEVVALATSSLLHRARAHDLDVEPVADLMTACRRRLDDEFTVVVRSPQQNAAFAVADDTIDRFVDELFDETEGDWPWKEFSQILCAGELYSSCRTSLTTDDETSLRRIHQHFYLGQSSPLTLQIQETLTPFASATDAEVVGQVAKFMAMDLTYCAESRALHGCSPTYYEYMFRHYQAGLWPAVWVGRWPVGGRFAAWTSGNVAEDHCVDSP